MNAAAWGSTSAQELLPRASSSAVSVDLFFASALWLGLFASVLLLGGLLLLRFLPRVESSAATSSESSAGARWWLATLTLLVLTGIGLSWTASTRSWAELQVPPRGSLRVAVHPEGFGWSFRYPNGQSSEELHLPLGEAVQLEISGGPSGSRFCVPAFRLQSPADGSRAHRECVQARILGEFTAFDPGEPARPAARVLVETLEDYDAWYQSISGPDQTLPPIDLGRASYQMRGCTQCHSLDGTPGVGPTFQGFARRERELVGGVSRLPDLAYLRESIYDPANQVVVGFEPVMPSFRGRIGDAEAEGLFAFLESLP